ncbi:GDCCVxC domain-containing (seleno)protein [Sphingomonas sp.]|uniref:GDCCVxC domain-containing (seleno)protein n=1 Tax=Sphingomonas sp. TaxID=28214 RepID=UPI0025FE85C2|nr:GDCCVxC domain-containing (seleno)protein [Sphingomonas sp.]
MADVEPTLISTITCPNCGGQNEEVMPTNACLFFYECPSCDRLLRPLSGHCCVFCSYGSVACPPIQASSGDEHHRDPNGQKGCHG